MKTIRINGQKFARIWYNGNRNRETWYPIENLRGLKMEWGFCN